jgi:hypothetical protein
VAARGGLNPYEYTQVNVREQCSWVHTDDHEAATEKAAGLVRAGIADPALRRSSRSWSDTPNPRHRRQDPGLRAAIGLADIGLRSSSWSAQTLGGWVGRFGGCTRTARTATAGRHAGGRGPSGARRSRSSRAPSWSPSPAASATTVDVRVGGRARAIQVLVGSIVVATGFDTYQPGLGSSATADGVLTLPEFKELLDGRVGTPGLARATGPQHRLRLLRRQPPAGRRERGQRVLLPLLLHGRRPRVGPGVAPRRDGPAVPPLPGHADVRQVRDALHRIAQGRLGLPPVRTTKPPAVAARHGRRLVVRPRPAHGRGGWPSRPTSWSSSRAWSRGRTRA